jgi:hypothetical protein
LAQLSQNSIPKFILASCILGRTDEETVAKSSSSKPVTYSWLITIQFDTSVEDFSPWKFVPPQSDIKVVSGETVLLQYAKEWRWSACKQVKIVRSKIKSWILIPSLGILNYGIHQRIETLLILWVPFEYTLMTWYGPSRFGTCLHCNTPRSNKVRSLILSWY